MKAIDELRELYLEDHKIRYPSMPDYARVSKKYSDKTANGLTRCIIDFLQLSGCQAERTSNTGRLIDCTKRVTDVLGNTRLIGSTQWIKGSGTSGTADISAVIQGRSVKIEVKIGRDRQSENQKRYQEQIEQAGGVYLMISSFDQFLTWYKSFAI